MTMTELRQRFGRPLRLGVIGGGPGVWIGDMHRFHRYDNVVAGETDRASSGITETVFPRELRSVEIGRAHV